jgi:H+/Cl- antiporter ClcA
MRRNPYALFALGAVCFALVIEVGTLDLGHEFTWFGKLSQQQGAWVRYCVFTLATLLVIAALVYRSRSSARSR